LGLSCYGNRKACQVDYINFCLLDRFLKIGSRSKDSDEEVIKDFVQIALKDRDAIEPLYYSIKTTRPHLIEKLDKLMVLI
jgi:hypothetical protein